MVLGAAKWRENIRKSKDPGFAPRPGQTKKKDENKEKVAHLKKYSCQNRQVPRFLRSGLHCSDNAGSSDCTHQDPLVLFDDVDAAELLLRLPKLRKLAQALGRLGDLGRACLKLTPELEISEFKK